jgi:hypothetical protein
VVVGVLGERGEEEGGGLGRVVVHCLL